MDFDVLRENMFDTQMRTWSVFKERVFEILRKVKRENFVSSEYLGQVFFDMELPLLDTSEMMFPPRVEARLLSSLCDRNYSSALVLGSGSGYFAALLSRVSNVVYCLERHRKLVDFSKKNFHCSNIENIDIVEADIFSYNFSSKRFDTIVLCGSVDRISDRFFSLAESYADVVGFEGVFPAVTAVRYHRSNNSSSWKRLELFDYYVPPFVNDNSSSFEF
ncbi:MULTISPECIES: protein-L-isoaspartate O-methyltransferase family protein [Candidatus Ichthyocystis]|uniref:protein-L-isoaspartate O-methyltransferase family protein n=1 Tax=Candidatus Ichthyocystis TaxID=2929841 RepID=UPI00158523A8|nr:MULTISPECIES: methyltransferase domain-containing protein [Ichthyocystis]